ncbi:MAG: hypothetical protein U0798_21150 [Gemmataceae bacterium]
MPLPRLIYKATYTLAGGNVKSCQYLNAVLFSLTALLALLTTIRLRGHASYADALIPLLLVGPSHWESLTMGFLIQFTSGLFLNFVLLTLMATFQSSVIRWTRLGAVFATTLLVGMCGSNSLTFMVSGSLWLAWIALTHWRISRAKSLVAGCLSVASMSAFIAIFKSLPSVNHVPATIPELFKKSLQFFSLALGHAGKNFGEFKPGYPVMGLILGVLFLAICMWCVWQLRHLRLSGRSSIAAAMICYAAGMGMLIAGITYGRAGAIPSFYIFNRYATLASPVVVLIFLGMITILPDRFRPFWSVALLIIVTLVAWPNWVDGKSQAKNLSDSLKEVEDDLKEGMPIPFLSDRYWFHVYFPGPKYMQEFLNEYTKIPTSIFYGAKPTLDVSYSPLNYQLISRDQTICRAHEVELMDWDGSFEMKLFDSPRPVYAVEMTYTLSHPSIGYVKNKITTWPHAVEHHQKPIINQLQHTNQMETTKIYFDRSFDRIRFDISFAKGTTLTIHSLREISLRAESAPRP